MAYSMMSSTNYKRKFEFLPKNHEGEDCCSSDENSINDWINVDLEDFLANEFDDDNGNKDSFFISSSKNSSDFSDAVFGFSLHGNNPENLMSKKRKTMENFVDHDLEDTASSPAQSPKVNDFNLFYMKSKEMENRDFYQENGIGNTSPQEGDRTNMSMIESELKKKGLCLIPTSMLLNYLSANMI